MSLRHARAGLALYSALAALLLVVSRVESLSTGSTGVAPRPNFEQSFRLALQVRDRAGRPLDARVRVAPESWRERLRLAQRDDLRAVAEDGELALELRAGAYRVFVSHGPEWSLAELSVTALGGAQVARLVELEHEVSLPGWHGADLHVHTESSRDAAAHGGVSASDLRAEGVELAAITDHNFIGNLEGFESVAGAEITTWAPEIGHFNAFPLRAVPKWRDTNPTALMRELTRDPRTFVQINHPRLDDHIAYFKLGGFDGARFSAPNFHLRVHGLEVWNGYDLARPERVLALLAEWRGWLVRGERLTATGGSDSHGAASHLAGYPRTYTQAARVEDLAPELRAGSAFVTNGPLLELRVNGHTPGKTVELADDERVTVELRVRAPSWMRVDTLELWADEQRAWSAPIPVAVAGEPLDFDAHLELPMHARVLHAVAHGGSGLDRLIGRSDVEPLAFTNAVHLVPALHAKR
jgi:hypothetical protein